jgi:hypothetical protein
MSVFIASAQQQPSTSWPSESFCLLTTTPTVTGKKKRKEKEDVLGG